MVYNCGGHCFPIVDCSKHSSNLFWLLASVLTTTIMTQPIIWELPNSDAWLELRKGCDFTASELGALLGVALYKSRAKIISEKRGASPEDTNEFKAKLFADGKFRVFETQSD